MEAVLSLLLFVLSLAVFAIVFSVAANFLRSRHEDYFELKPNCLLTRHPVVFLTGVRSIFYFQKYWNTYPALLAEHGYEVFTVHLPWKGRARLERMRQFLSEQQKLGKAFHFIMDAPTKQEFTEILNQNTSVLSITIPSVETTDSNFFASASPTRNSSTLKTPTTPLLTSIAFHLHRFLNAGSSVPTASDLGAEFPKGAAYLLERMQLLGEEDFLR